MTQQKIIVSGILAKNGSVLLAKRAHTKRIAPGKYHLPGGHVEFGESPSDALVREFYEEFRLTVRTRAVVRTFSYVIGDAHTVGITYELIAPEIPEPIELDQDDNESVAWVGVDELLDYLSVDDHDFVTLKQYFDSLSQEPTV